MPETTTLETAHRPLALWVGSGECLERDCDDYADEDGEPDPGVERCSHIRDELVCGGCSIAGDDGEYETTVPWPCPLGALPDPDRAPRPVTPDVVLPDGSRRITMQRACNGCGTRIGDVSDVEMECGMNAFPLPDVRGECPTCTP